MSDEPLMIPLLWRPLEEGYSFQVGDRVVYERPSWDPNFSWGDRHGEIIEIHPGHKSQNVQSMPIHPFISVRWDGLNSKVEHATGPTC